jgi:hypothetical protein
MKINKSILFIVMALSAPALAQSPQTQPIDHLAIRGIAGKSTLLHQDQTRVYFHVARNGSSVIYAFHNVGRDEDVVEHTDAAIPEYHQFPEHRFAFRITKSEQDYFNKHLLEPFLKLSPDNTLVGIAHYNANFLLTRTPHLESNFESEPPLIYTMYRAPLKWLQGDRSGGWEVDFGEHRIARPGLATVGDLPNFLWSFSVEEALAYREIRSENLQLAQKETSTQLAEEQRAAAVNRERLINEEMARRKPGIVYKSDHFWDPIPNHETIRHVFEGEFSSIENRYDFMRAFNGYVTMYSGRCNAHLPEGRVNRNWASQTVTRDVAGREKYRGPVVEHVMEMDPRFGPYYDSYSEALESHQVVGAFSMASDMISAVMQPGADPFSIVGTKVTEAIEQDSFYQLSFFFSNTDCTSATTKQLNENMYRAAAKLPSLQQAGQRLAEAEAEAEAESDSAEKFLFQKTFIQACNRYFIELRNLGAQRFCRCLDGETRSVMTPQERQKYTDTFGAYFTEIDKAYKMPNDPRWRLQAPLNNCRN